MAKVIVGIHGLANKPEREILTDWWVKSIHEGLQKNCEIADPEFDFRMVHWADLLYKYPVHRDAEFKFDKLYNNQPYKAAGPGSLERYNDGLIDTIRAGALGMVGSTLDFAKEHFNMNRLADWVLGKVLKDLDFYYDDERIIADRAGQPTLAAR